MSASDLDLARRIQQVENEILHEQAVLPGVIRDLEQADIRRHQPARDAADHLRHMVNVLPQIARDLRNLRGLLEA